MTTIDLVVRYDTLSLEMEGSEMAERKYDKAHKAEYDRKYKRQNIQNIAFSLHRETDAELIAIYKSIPDKAAWFRKCLMEYKG